MAKHIFKVDSRDVGANLKVIRKNKLVPGNVFGPEIESIALKFNSRDFDKLYRQIGESGIAYLQLDKKEIPVMIEEAQTDPVTDKFIHVSFKAINLKEKTQAEIPVELVGEFELAEAVLVTVRDHVEVEALPTDLPEKFVVDVSKLTELGQSITLEDLDFDRSKVDLVVGDEGADAPVVLVQKVEEEEVEEIEETPETVIIGEEDSDVEGEGEATSPEAQPDKQKEETQKEE